VTTTTTTATLLTLKEHCHPPMGKDMGQMVFVPKDNSVTGRLHSPCATLFTTRVVKWISVELGSVMHR
jgi:hypothetical protein